MKIRHKQVQKHKEAIQTKDPDPHVINLCRANSQLWFYWGWEVVSTTSQQRRRKPGSGSRFGSPQHGDADESLLPRTS